jgi:hypothetical protein
MQLKCLATKNLVIQITCQQRIMYDISETVVSVTHALSKLNKAMTVFIYKICLSTFLSNKLNYIIASLYTSGSVSTVGIATGYWLDESCSSPSRVRNFRFPISSRPALWFTQPPMQWVTGIFLRGGVKRQRRGADHSSSTSTEVKKT